MHNTYHGAGGIISSLSFLTLLSFYINLPVGGVAIAMIALVLPVPKQPLTSLPLRQKLREIDLLGATLFIG